MLSASSTGLYKYLDVSGALLTLRNRNFKHSKPSDFNDQTDMTIERVFPGADEVALTAMWDNLTNVIVNNIDTAPSCLDGALREMIVQIQDAFKQFPEKIEFIKAEAKKISVTEMYDLDLMKDRAVAFINETNDLLQDFRILCVSEKPDSMRMWCKYAQAHEGIAIRILPNVQKDSKYALFRPVKYQEQRPPLYDDPVSFLESGLFDDQKERTKLILDKIVYAKTSEWAYEKEWRLVIPIVDGNDWNVMPYHAEEISEVLLGAKINHDVKREIVTLAKAINPDVAIFQAVKGSTEVSFYLVE